MASSCHPATERTLRATLSDLRTRVLETLPLFAPVNPLGGGRVLYGILRLPAAEANTRTPLDVQTKLVQKTCRGKPVADDTPSCHGPARIPVPCGGRRKSEFHRETYKNTDHAYTRPRLLTFSVVSAPGRYSRSRITGPGTRGETCGRRI